MAPSSSSSVLLLATLIVSAALLQRPCSAAGRKLNVGGNSGWDLATNFGGWANKAGPFRVGDTLVFNYGSRRGVRTSALPHNVYLMKDQAHYQNCDFSGAVLVSNGGSQAQYTLKQKKPHYFACSIGNGLHCQAGMKVAVTPR